MKIYFLICFLLVSYIYCDQYSVVIDAGSTGSRAYIFKFSQNNEGKKIVESKKGLKVEPGLSSIDSDKNILLNYLLPLIIDAKSQIPLENHKETSIHIKGTAGMRLLPNDSQDILWKLVYEVLTHNKQFPFKLRKEDLGTIDGHDEAFYAVLSSNFIEGSIDAELRPQLTVPMIGAFDMGGSSTQLIFYVGNTSKTSPVTRDDFWSHSWINFGVEKMREKIIDKLLNSIDKSDQGQRNANVNIGFDGEVSLQYNTQDPENKIFIANPCTFVGHEHVWNNTHVLFGTGNGKECVNVLKSIIWPDGEEDDDDGVVEANSNESTFPKYIGGVRPPPLQGHFYGMSVYFYALDCIRHLGPLSVPHWPSPRIDDLEAAAHAFCGLEWEFVRNNLQDIHQYTKNTQLPHRCVEALYIVTLLEHAFGIPGHQRNVTLALDVRGMEVEWTLGYALAVILPSINLMVAPSKRKVKMEVLRFGNINVINPIVNSLHVIWKFVIEKLYRLFSLFK